MDDAFEVPWISKIEWLRRLLNDQYLTGIPIVKELLQNADDADATRLEIGIVPGLRQSGAGHVGNPLLNGPALMVANDGPFTDDNAVAIRQLGLSNKPGERGAIGRFGLGLKSIFHLCEAFFYLSSNNHARMLNPWSGSGEHSEWRNFEESHQQLMREMVARVLNSDRWFCLWIPLRQLAHESSYSFIKRDFVLDECDDVAATIFPQDTAWELAGMLPMLRCVRNVRICDLRETNETLFSIHCSAGRFFDGKSEEPQAKPLKGTLSVATTDQPPVSTKFAGRERLVELARHATLSDLKEDRHWPLNSGVRADGTYFQEDAKAFGHGAAYFHVKPKANQCRVAGRWALFLPIESQPELNETWSGPADITLTLHGYFFVDAGRRHVNFGADTEQPIETEEALQTRWNRRLRDEIVLPLLIPALEDFVTENQYSYSEVAQLVFAVEQSAFFGRHHLSICRCEQFVPKLTRDGPKWTRTTSSTIHPLPNPPASRPQIAWDVFPALEDFGECVTAAGEPQLCTTPDRTPWAHDSLEVLCTVQSEEIIADPAKLNYFADTWHLVTNSSGQEPETRRRLLDTLNSFLAKVPLKLVLQNAGPFKRLIACLPADACIALPTPHNSQAASDVFQELFRINTTLLALPDSLVPDGTVLTGKLTSDDARAILNALTGLPAESQAGTNFFVWRSKTACVTFESVEDGRQSVRNEFAKHRWFPGALHTDGQAKGRLCSIEELLAFASQDLLFVGNRRQNELATALERALEGRSVLVVEPYVADVLRPDYEPRELSIAAILGVLDKRPALSNESHRAALLQHILNECREDALAKTVTRRSVRYLFHGDTTTPDDEISLLVEPETFVEPVWPKLLDATRQAGDANARVISPSLSQHINTAQRDLLGVQPIGRGSIPDEIRRIGAQNVDCSSLSDEDVSVLLRQMKDDDILRELSIHTLTTGARAAISGNGHWTDGSFVVNDEMLLEHVQLLRVSADSMLAARQHQLLPAVWGPRTAIDIITCQSEPETHFHAMLQAWLNLDDDGKSDQWEQVTTTAWLPTTSGQAVAPRNVIHWPEYDGSLQELLPDDCEFVTFSTLCEAFRNHERCKELITDLLPSRLDALKMLGQALSKDERYRLGSVAETDFSAKEFCLAFSDATHVMPASRIVERIPKNWTEQTHEFVRPLLHKVGSVRMVAILNFLAQQAQSCEDVASRENARGVFLWYLRAAASQHEFQKEVLPGIVLLNRRGRWKTPSDLSVGALGIDGTNVLAEEHYALVTGKVTVNNRNQVGRDGNGDVPTAYFQQGDNVEAEFNAGAQRVVELCRRMESFVAPAALGGMLCMLGDHPAIVRVAQEYIGQVSPSTFRAKVDWRASTQPRGPFTSIADAIGKHRFLIDVSRDQTVEVINLVGDVFNAQVQKDFSHLLIGHIGLVPGRDGLVRWTRRLCFRDVGEDQLTSRDVNQLLFETTVTLLGDVFEQRDKGLIQEMWSDLLRTDQIDVKIAEEYILDSAFTYLATVMGSDLHEDLVSIWKRWDKARRQRVEAEISGSNRQSMLDEADSKEREARDDLRKLLTTDAETQRKVLQAVRRKIDEHYQYNPNSIAFELFQNADDAAVELEDLYGEESPEACRADRVTIYASTDVFRFQHWGRPINKFMSEHFSEAEGRALGFDQDLEKMLMLARSDKASRRDGRQKTGKFGLGFKSVFLATDAPRVISGRLAFEVLGGFLPRRLEENERQRLMTLCEDFETGTSRLRNEGTLIELPLHESIAGVDDIVAAFRRLIGYLLVFARHIKRCRLEVADEDPEDVEWSPGQVFGIATFHSGRIERFVQGIRESMDLFVINGRHLAIIFAFDRTGFIPLPTDVPAIWVTTPTQESLRLGLAINAMFDVDIGRASLVEASTENSTLADNLGRELADYLSLLYEQSQTDAGWNELRGIMSLGSGCGRYELWESFWQLTAAGMEASVRGGSGAANDVVRRIFWGGAESGVAFLYNKCDAMPSNLDVEGYRALTSISKVTHVLVGCLDEHSDILTAVSGWDKFRSQLRTGRVVSYSRIWKVIENICPQILAKSPVEIDLCSILELEGELANTIDVEQAKRLGTAINGENLDRLESTTGQLRVEAAHIRERLGFFEFRGRDGNYHRAQELLIGVPCDDRPKEEQRRADFAPDDRVLHDDYTGKAIPFFLLCRKQMTASLEDMVQWALSADAESKRQAVLVYLRDGEYGLMLAAYLRAAGLQDSWLAEHDMHAETQHAETDGNPVSAAVAALLGVGGSDQSREFNEEDANSPELEERQSLDAAAVLPRIWEWWSAEGTELLAEHEASLYPSELQPHISGQDPGDDVAERKSWLVLLIRGMLEIMGRTQARQHRAFLRLCNERYWLDQLAASEHPSRDLLQSVEAYVDDERHSINIEYFHWLRQFLGFSTVARHLDVYSRAFLDIDRYDGDFSLDRVLRPRHFNPDYRGTDMDAPPLDPALGIGVCFVVRELVRQGVLTRNQHAWKYCFVPVKGVRDLFTRLGCDNLQRDSIDRWMRSKTIFDFVLRQLDGDTDKASYGMAFDIPFYIVSSQPNLQEQLLGELLY